MSVRFIHNRNVITLHLNQSRATSSLGEDNEGTQSGKRRQIEKKQRKPASEVKRVEKEILEPVTGLKGERERLLSRTSTRASKKPLMKSGTDLVKEIDDEFNELTVEERQALGDDGDIDKDKDYDAEAEGDTESTDAEGLAPWLSPFGKKKVLKPASARTRSSGSVDGEDDGSDKESDDSGDDADVGRKSGKGGKDSRAGRSSSTALGRGSQAGRISKTKLNKDYEAFKTKHEKREMKVSQVSLALRRTSSAKIPKELAERLQQEMEKSRRIRSSLGNRMVKSSLGHKLLKNKNKKSARQDQRKEKGSDSEVEWDRKRGAIRRKVDPKSIGRTEKGKSTLKMNRVKLSLRRPSSAIVLKEMQAKLNKIYEETLRTKTSLSHHNEKDEKYDIEILSEVEKSGSDAEDDMDITKQAFESEIDAVKIANSDRVDTLSLSKSGVDTFDTSKSGSPMKLSRMSLSTAGSPMKKSRLHSRASSGVMFTIEHADDDGIEVRVDDEDLRQEMINRKSRPGTKETFMSRASGNISVEIVSRQKSGAENLSKPGSRGPSGQSVIESQMTTHRSLISTALNVGIDDVTSVDPSRFTQQSFRSVTIAMEEDEDGYKSDGVFESEGKAKSKGRIGDVDEDRREDMSGIKDGRRKLPSQRLRDLSDGDEEIVGKERLDSVKIRDIHSRGKVDGFEGGDDREASRQSGKDDGRKGAGSKLFGNEDDQLDDDELENEDMEEDVFEEEEFDDEEEEELCGSHLTMSDIDERIWIKSAQDKTGQVCRVMINSHNQETTILRTL